MIQLAKTAAGWCVLTSGSPSEAWDIFPTLWPYDARYVITHFPFDSLLQSGATLTLVCPMEVDMQLDDSFEVAAVGRQFAVGVLQAKARGRAQLDDDRQSPMYVAVLSIVHKDALAKMAVCLLCGRRYV